MKPKFVVLCLLTIALLSVITIVNIAQENNPLVNEDANACYAGGAFAGMCDSMDVDDDGDADSFDSEWCWRCGWYYIRVEYGIFPPEILDGICKEVPPPVIVEEEDDDDDHDHDKDTKKKVRRTPTPEPTEEVDIPV